MLVPCGAGQAANELVLIHRQESGSEVANNSAGSRFSIELGNMLAEHMGRDIRFVDLPRKRMIQALEAGEGDIVCGYIPAWLVGPFDWSRPFIPEEAVIVSVAGPHQPKVIGDLKGQRIGTVLGFNYPDLERELGAEFVCDDGQSTNVALRKLIAGRFDHMVTTRAMINSHLKRGDVPASLHVLSIKKNYTQCAVSRRGHVSVEELNRAIDAISRSGELARSLQKER
jgi:ABC-type amino acid transport substrate-binding protein